MQIYLYLLALWALMWVVFYGWGVIACRIARCDRDDDQALLVNPWIGIASILGVLQIWHLAAPITTLTCVVICTIGILGAAAFNPARLELIISAMRRNALLATVAALVTVWLANRSLSPPNYVDHGLYYLNTIRWASEHPIVPGLANLHNRLGFNNSTFLLHAMLESLTGRGHSGHLLNGLMAALCVPIVVQGFYWIVRGTANERQVGWFTLALAMIVSSAAVDGRICSATPDFPATVFVTIAAWRLLSMSAFEEESRAWRLRWNLLAIGTLATAAVTMKIFAAFFAGLAGIALVVVLYRMNRVRSERPLTATIRSLAFTAICSLLLFVPWAGRGYILSGYPLFPSTIAGAPVEWKYNAQAAANLQRTVRLWSRTYHLNYETGYDGWGWIPEWIVQVALLRAPVETAIPAGIAVCALVVLAGSGLRSQPKQYTTEPPATSFAPGTTAFLKFAAWALAAAHLGTVILWFIAAPSPRFGSYALWGLAAVLLGLLSQTTVGQWKMHYPKLLIAALMALLLLPMLDEAARIELRHRHKLDHFAHGKHFYHFYPFVLPNSDGFPPVPKGDLLTRTTDSGLEVYLAARLPDGTPGLLWDSPLPAARFFKPGLALRRSGDLRGGFKINPSPNPQDESTHDR